MRTCHRPEISRRAKVIGTADNTLTETPDCNKVDDALNAAGKACFHCGEPCRDAGFASEGKLFCCQGCQVVHDLLAGNDLGQFYELGEHPGSRMRRPADRRQWTFLDEPALRQRLLDFADGRTSRVTFRIPAIHCVACVWLLENLFRLHPGIGRSLVNFPRREAAITFSSDELKLSELVTLLASIGYEPALNFGEVEKRRPNSLRRRQWLQIGVAGFAFGNIMIFSLPQYFGLDSFSGPVLKTAFGWMSLVLALPVVLFSASDYWRSALVSLRQRTLTLEVPIVLGLAAIYGRSAFEVVLGAGEGYFDSLTGLIFFLLCGRVFQQKTYDRMAFDRDYKSFFPLSVTRVLTEGEDRVALSEIQVGDRLIIRNGELIPADSTLASGAAQIDYSFVTGESEPVAKLAGNYLYAGGQQVGGAIEIETVKKVSQSYLTSLWNHEAFQKNRDENINTLTNRYSRWFTLVVLLTAVGAGVFWWADGNLPRGFKSFISVLIVACPCALALAAPFTLGTAQRFLARLQIFLKNSVVLERMARADAIVFDKTGTLTAAGAGAVRFFGSPQLGREEAAWIQALARQSTHPHSARISEWLADCNEELTVADYRETAGSGIEGKAGGHKIWLGSASWLTARGVVLGTGISAEGPAVHVAIDGRYRGMFSLSSSLRPEADRLLRELADRYDIALLSGDNERERERFRSLFGGDARLHFNQSPLDKLGFIRRLQESGKTVIMVGDGLNDAGALRQSDVGVAVVEKVGAFSPASDVILAAGRVPRLAEVLGYARSSVRIVKMGFVISALYNVVGVSLAAAGVLSPVYCAVLMPLSSITVVLFACGTATWSSRRIRLACDRYAGPGVVEEVSA